MKRLLAPICALALAGSPISTTLGASEPVAGAVDFGSFTPSKGGGDFVEVHIKSNLISMVARLAQREAPEVSELLQGLQLIHVNAMALNDNNRAEVTERVQKIRRELDDSGWERIVTAQRKDEDVAVYLKTRGGEAIQGLAVTVLSPKKGAVLANIVGDIRPEQLSTVGERFNIEPLKELGLKPKK